MRVENGNDGWKIIIDTKLKETVILICLYYSPIVTGMFWQKKVEDITWKSITVILSSKLSPLCNNSAPYDTKHYFILSQDLLLVNNETDTLIDLAWK